MFEKTVSNMSSGFRKFIREMKIRTSNKLKKKYIKTYSQCGEDVIISYALSKYNIANPYYVDIGAHDPFYLSNSAYFYERGANGICIEADPDLFSNIKKNRARDICLNCAVSIKDGESTFYRMESPTLNTISEEEARRMEREGLCKVKEELIIDTYNINTVLSRFAKQKPNLISIDAEGVDDIIIDSLNFKLYYPEVLCIETLEFSNDFYQKKKNLLIEKVISKGYTVYADTNINTIFIRKNVVSW